MAFAGQSVTRPVTPLASTRAELGRGWPPVAQQQLWAAVRKYGWPSLMSPEVVGWYFNAPWKRSFIYRRGRRHMLPKAHADICEQIVDYFVPPNRRLLLAQFWPYVIYDERREELTARCASEEMNCILLNAVHEVILGQLSPPAAWQRIRELVAARKKNWPEPWAEDLIFRRDPMFSDERARILSEERQRAV